MSKRRILITGATGGLGMALVREALSRGHNVRAIGRSKSAGLQIEAMGAQFSQVDLAASQCDLRDLLAECESVIHAAALSASWGRRADFETINVGVTDRLLDSASRGDIARFVFVSSPSVFAAFRDRIQIGEHENPESTALNHYARTKFAAERQVLAPRQDKMACCAIRPRALVGPGDRVILPKLAELAERKYMPLPRGGSALIELTDLRDAAWAICEAEERAIDLAGQAINISGGNPITVREVASELCQTLGKAPILVSMPVGVARSLAILLEYLALMTRSAREPKLTRYTLATLAFSQTFDLKPAMIKLGYKPQFDALETLLQEARRRAVPEEGVQ